MAEAKTKLIELTAEIVANYVANNATAVSDLPSLIKATHDALAGVESGGTVESKASDVQKPTPAQIRKSITPDALISFEDAEAPPDDAGPDDRRIQGEMGPAERLPDHGARLQRSPFGDGESPRPRSRRPEGKGSGG